MIASCTIFIHASIPLNKLVQENGVRLKFTSEMFFIGHKRYEFSLSAYKIAFI